MGYIAQRRTLSVPHFQHGKLGVPPLPTVFTPHGFLLLLAYRKPVTFDLS